MWNKSAVDSVKKRGFALPGYVEVLKEKFFTRSGTRQSYQQTKTLGPVFRAYTCEDKWQACRISELRSEFSGHVTC